MLDSRRRLRSSTAVHYHVHAIYFVCIHQATFDSIADDPEAALASYRDIVKEQAGTAGSVRLSSTQFQQVCVTLGIDKEVEVAVPDQVEGSGEEKEGEEGDNEDAEADEDTADAEEADENGNGEGDDNGEDEDGEAAPPAPPAPKEYTNNFVEVWNLAAASSGGATVEAPQAQDGTDAAEGADAQGEQNISTPSPSPSTDGADLLVRLRLVTRGFGEPAFR